MGSTEAGQPKLERLDLGRLCASGRPRNRDRQRRRRSRIWPAFNSWLIDNRFNLRPSDRSALLALMGILPAIEAWRATLAETRRVRMNHPATVMRSYRVATGIKSTPEHIALPPSPAATSLDAPSADSRRA